MTRAVLLAGAFLLGLAIGRRRPRAEWMVINWRDLERVDSV